MIEESVFVQQGSSQTLNTSDENRWYVIKEIWEGSQLLDARIIASASTKEEALAIIS